MDPLSSGPAQNVKMCKNTMKAIILKTSFASIGCALLLLTGGMSAQAQSFSNAVVALNPVAYWPLAEFVTPGGLDCGPE